MKMRSLTASFVFVLVVSIAELNAIITKNNQVLLIALDGFRHDYYERYRTDLTSLTRIANNSVQAVDGIKSMFPKVTYPVFWSIATGLNPQNHGVVNNNFYDPIRKEVFSQKKLDNSWLEGEPIWSTAVRQNMRVGIIHWIGSGMGSLMPPEE